MTRGRSKFLVILAYFMLVAGWSKADAVSDRLKAAMEDCVSVNADRLGSPVQDTKFWAKIIGSHTAVAFSLVPLLGYEGYPDLQSAVSARTTEFLIKSLEEKGFKGFRGQAMETVNYCLPFALVAASDELQAQASRPCPDDTDYKSTIKDLGSTESELRARWGSYWKEPLDRAGFTVRVQFLVAFPDLYYFGGKDHPKFDASASGDNLNAALTPFSSQDVIGTASQIEPALIAARDYQGPEKDRVKKIESQLLCLQDWIDIYPTDDIARLIQKE